MDPRINPFSPGAGTQPPELAGREAILQGASVVLARIKHRRGGRSQMLLGLRGVGKTVLLNRIEDMAEEEGYLVLVIEAPEGRRLVDMLALPLRSMLLRLSRIERSRDIARRGLAVLKAFAGAFKVSVGEIDLTLEAESGTADSGNLEVDLPEMLMAVALAAREAEKGICLVIDEVQYLSEKDLSALIVSMHRIGQKNLPVVLFGAGLPQLAALAGEAKSYAERLFDYPEVGPLPKEAAMNALRAPIQRAGAEITEEALDAIIEKTNGYPYFLQEWGSHAWDVAPQSPITCEDVGKATTEALKRLVSGFFRVRLDRLTPRERDYVRAMAELGPGPHRSGEIAQAMGMGVTAAGPLRNTLIKKGMIFSPQHGDTAFTVPMFDEFMRRAMPDQVVTVVPATKKPG